MIHVHIELWAYGINTSHDIAGSGDSVQLVNPHSDIPGSQLASGDTLDLLHKLNICTYVCM